MSQRCRSGMLPRCNIGLNNFLIFLRSSCCANGVYTSYGKIVPVKPNYCEHATKICKGARTSFYIETFDVQRFHQDLRNACFFSLRCATVAVITNFHPQFLGSSVHVGMAGMSYRHLAEQHAARVKFLATVLYEHLVSPDDGDFLSRTGSLVRCRNLRNKKNRKTFHDLVAASQEYLYGDKTARFWTLRVVSDAILSDLPSD